MKINIDLWIKNLEIEIKSKKFLFRRVLTSSCRRAHPCLIIEFRLTNETFLKLFFKSCKKIEVGRNQLLRQKEIKMYV